MKRKITVVLCFVLSFTSLSLNGQEGNILRELYLNEVYFDFASYLIKDEMIPVFKEAVGESKSLDNFFIEITAHTDSIGSDENNKALSQKRADAVKKYLTEELGVPADKISAQVYGESQPVADNTTEEGRKLNRRATIVLYQVLPKDPEMDPEMAKEKEEPAEEVIEPEPEIVEETPPPPPPVVKKEPEVVEEKEPEVIYTSEEGQDTIKAGETFEIKNLYFEANSSLVRDESLPAMKTILDFMKANESVKIEIGGHINLPLSETLSESDYELSVQRAKIVYQYLFTNGIELERMEYKGYGNTQMKYPFPKNEDEENQNMRVEIKVLEIGR